MYAHRHVTLRHHVSALRQVGSGSSPWLTAQLSPLSPLRCCCSASQRRRQGQTPAWRASSRVRARVVTVHQTTIAPGPCFAAPAAQRHTLRVDTAYWLVSRRVPGLAAALRWAAVALSRDTDPGATCAPLSSPPHSRQCPTHTTRRSSTGCSTAGPAPRRTRWSCAFVYVSPSPVCVFSQS